jgi:BON domain-containing protein
MKRFASLVSVAGLVFTVACGQTDAGITTSVKSKLAADDLVKAYQVDVDTNNHVVTLRGDVETMAQKDQAIRLARETNGVRDVIDQLRVDPTAATSGRLDADGDAVDVDVDADVDVDRDAEAKARGAAEKVGDGVKKGAGAVVDGAKKVGSEVKDAVTDDDRDSDKDGK